MAIANYNQVLTMARQLELTEQLKLLQALIGTITTDLNFSPVHHSIYELKGLGRDIWQGLDVDDYLKQERATWDG